MGLYDNIRILQHKQELEKVASGNLAGIVPLHVRLEPSELCNFRCIFCWWHNKKKREVLPSFKFNGRQLFDNGRFLSLIDELADLGTRAVSFTGTGDPLMHPHMKIFLNKIRQREIVFGLTSNMAMPMDDALIQGLIEAQWLRWSMNAGSQDTYLATANPKGNNPEKAFACAKSNILRINQARRDCPSTTAFNASYVITTVNEPDVYEATRLAKELGVDSIAFRPDTPLERQSNSNTYSNEVRDTIEKARLDFETDVFKVYSNFVRQDDVRKQNDSELICFYSNHTVYIDARGDVYPCCYTRYDSGYVIGNIMNQSFQEFWRQPARVANYKKLLQDSCPACGYGRINASLKPLYLKNVCPKELWLSKEIHDFFI